MGEEFGGTGRSTMSVLTAAEDMRNEDVHLFKHWAPFYALWEIQRNFGKHKERLGNTRKGWNCLELLLVP